MDDDPTNPSAGDGSLNQALSSKEVKAPENANITTRVVDSSLYAEKTRRIKQLESELKALKGHVDVFKSKAQLAAERENFLLEEISRASEDMLCKFFAKPPSS